MTTFAFSAPKLFEPAAVPSEGLLGALHDAPGDAEHLAKSEKFARWFTGEMEKKGYAAKGPFVDEGSWIVEVPSNGGFVVCFVSGPDGGDPLFRIMVADFDGAGPEVGKITETILRTSSEITGLSVKA